MAGPQLGVEREELAQEPCGVPQDLRARRGPSAEEEEDGVNNLQKGEKSS